MPTYLDLSPLALGIASLMLVLAAATITFSYRYLEGEANAKQWRAAMLALLTSGLVFVLSQHIAPIIASWLATSALLIYSLSRASGKQSASQLRWQVGLSLGSGSLCLSIALIYLAKQTGQWTIPEIAQHAGTLSAGVSFAAGVLILVAAMAQSALFPFHRWLMQSLLAPTPFSALLHAGIISAGGVLLMRFAWLFELHAPLQGLTVIAGCISVLVGGLAMRTQSEVKRALLCSTVTQMGFMVLQCGLGLYAVALCHLVLHGFFKAYRFLASGAVMETAEPASSKHDLRPSRLAPLTAAALLTSIFMSLTGKQLSDASMPLVLFVAWAAFSWTQQSIQRAGDRVIPIILSLCLALPVITLYAGLLLVAERALGANNPGPLSWVHVAGTALCFLAAASRLEWLSRSKRLYMWALNSATPPPSALLQVRSLPR